ncbi:MAG: beta strand repeat-containing protein, partial [Gemmatimonadales bacterium]
ATGSVGGLTGSPVTFIATANHGNAAQLAKQAGDGQGATVNTTVSVPPAVIVKDAYGNAIAGAGVTFAVTGGGGSGTGLNPTTDASGIATVGSWRLGTAAGPNVLQATSGALTPVTFTATGNPDVPASVAKQAGDGQSATVGTAVSTPPRVLVTDQFGNPVPGVTVSFAVTSGGGTVNGGSVTNVSSSGAGLASVAWTLGTTSGSNTMTATAGALTPATFTATATTGAPQALALQGGDGQADTIGTTLPTPYAVSVADQFGNPVSAVNVTFTITAGGGAINGMAGPVVVATNAGGTASVTRTLGTTAGTQTVQATASVPSGSPVTFTATANPGNPTTIAANSSIGLTGTVNTTVSPIPSVKVTDRGGNGVSGVAVTFAPSSAASGSVMGGSPSTGVTGVATVTSWTLDQIVGNDTLLATSSGLTGSPVRFVAASSPGAVSLSVSTLTASSSQITACNASCTTGGGTASTITATVKDQFGNVIAGRTVTLSSTGTANAFAPGASGTTDASGVFSATFSSTAAQAKTISGSVTGSGTLTQTAAVTVNPDVNTLLGSSVVTATSPIAASSGSTLSTITVTVRDQFLNPVSGRTVTIAVSPVTGNTVTQPGSLTNASGQTTGTFSTTKAETKTATASVNGTGGGSITDNALVTVTAAAASSIVVNAGNSQTVRVGTAVATDPSVLVRDAFLNPVPSASVTFTPSGGGSVTGSPATTDAIGIATVTSWTLGSTGTENADGTFSNSLSASTAGAGSTSFSASAFYTLSGDVQPIYTASCATAGCHVSGGTAPNLSAGSSRASTVGVTATCNPGFQRVQASNATNSVMYRRILDAGICSTFMPPGTSGLNTTQQKIIRAWINNGALNN